MSWLHRLTSLWENGRKKLPGRNKKIENRYGEKKKIWPAPLRECLLLTCICTVLYWYGIWLPYISIHMLKDKQRMPLFPPKEAACFSVKRTMWMKGIQDWRVRERKRGYIEREQGILSRETEHNARNQLSQWLGTQRQSAAGSLSSAASRSLTFTRKPRSQEKECGKLQGCGHPTINCSSD